MDKTIEFLKKNVLHYRTTRGLTQQKLAEDCGVSTYYISGIERGHNSPSLKVITKIANALNIPVYLLFVDTENHEDKVLELYSEELQKELCKLVVDLKKRY